MWQLYGTHLMFKIQQTLQKATEPMSTKEISQNVANGFMLEQRELKNLECRVRGALNELLDQKTITRIATPRNNILQYKFQINGEQPNG